MEIVLIILPYVLLIILGLISWKTLPAYLNKKAENLATKEDIAQITREVESVKSTFEKEKIRFSWFHQKQAKVIGMMYSMLSEHLDNLNYFKNGVDIKTGKTLTPEEAFERTARSVFSVKIYYNKNRIYFNEELKTKIDNVTNSFVMLFVDFSIDVFKRKNILPANYEDLLKESGKPVQEANELLEDLERDFKKILSGE